MINSKQLRINFIFVIFAQLITLIVSCTTNLLLPKFITTLSYSYWQLFIFYAGYVPCLALGLNDGIYLRLGGKKISELDLVSVKSQYIFGQLFQVILASIIFLPFICIMSNSNKVFVFLFVFLYFISYTSFNFLNNVYQSVNEIKTYALATVIFQLAYFLFQIVFVATRQSNIFILIFGYIIANFISVLYLLRNIHSLFKNAKFNLSIGRHEVFVSMKTGISLMIANICSMLVLGVGRQIIEFRWGILTFGKISFALALINFALMFIIQVGAVLFPTLRRLSREHLKEVFANLTNRLFIILPIIYLAYIPGKLILQMWLPKYSESINYLGILLPICFFDCRMNLVNSTIFKVLNRQVLLLEINIITIVISVVTGMIGAYIINNMYFVICSLVFSVMTRCIISDYIISKWMQFNINVYVLLDVLLCILFMILANNNSSMLVILVLLIAFILRYILIKIIKKRV